MGLPDFAGGPRRISGFAGCLSLSIILKSLLFFNLSDSPSLSV